MALDGDRGQRRSTPSASRRGGGARCARTRRPRLARPRRPRSPPRSPSTGGRSRQREQLERLRAEARRAGRDPSPPVRAGAAAARARAAVGPARGARCDRALARAQGDLHLRRLGRRRQDDHLGRDRARHGRAREEGRGAHDRPRAAARQRRSACPSSATRSAGSRSSVDGELWAMMLDAKRTFDELIEWHAPDERTRDAVLSNRIYQELSSAVAGSQEYMAMEKLLRAAPGGPLRPAGARHAARPATRSTSSTPREKLSAFIDSRSLQLLHGAGAARAEGARARQRASLFSVMKRATGIDLLQDLSEFFRSFGGHDRRLPRARRARERAARRQPHGLRARHLPAARRDRRGASASTAA